jgi:conjugative relaxase-like TrwC/TraI family protein
MRRAKTLKAGCKAKEDYYLEDESLDSSAYYSAAEINSEAKKFTTAQWLGQAAASVGLEGYIDKAQFKNLFFGALPDGTRIRQEKVSGKDNLVVDQVLSAPKSFSMYALKDDRLFDAHVEAVKKTQQAIERYGLYREYQDGRKVNVKGEGLLCAALPHWTSRENEMQLHTHLLTFNGVQRADGQWRALDDRQLGYAEWIGSFYRNELSKLTQEAGYRIVETKLKSGYSFEIEGVSRKEIEHFSSRSMQIAAKAELDQNSRNAAVLSTRKPKHITKSFEEFRNDFLEEMEQRGSLTQTPVSGAIADPIGRTDAKAEIDSAIRHYSERSCSFSREDLLKYALDHIQNFELSDLDHAIDTHTSLIEVADPTRQRFTTAEGLEQNIRIIQKWHAAPAVEPIMDEDTAIQLLRIGNLLTKEKALNPGQTSAIVGVLSSHACHQIIDGLAGVGKTTALQELKRLNAKADKPLKICGFSPTIEASKTLEKEMGIQANTLESLLRSNAPRDVNELWVVDEDGLTSTRQKEELIDKAAIAGARLLLVGDPKQNKSVEAGSPMRLLMQNGAVTHRIHEIIRQQNKYQKEAVELIASGKGLEALTLLNKHKFVTEIKTQDARARAVANSWLSLSKPERLQTIVVTGTNAERLRITNYIRDGLRAEGKLGKEKVIQQLVSRQLTHELKKRSEEYQKGDYVQISSPRKGSSFAKGKTYKVVDHRGDRVLLESEQGQRRWMDPKRHRGIEVYYTQDMGIAVGDRLKWKITNKEQGYDNGAEFTVKRIQGTAIWIEDKAKKLHKIDSTNPLGIDYSLVSTGYSAQGQTAYRAIVSATNDPASAKEPFYVEISRQRMELLIFTEDYAELKKWVQRSSIEANPLELIGDNYHDYRQNSPTPRRMGSRTISEQSDHRYLNSADLASDRGEQARDRINESRPGNNDRQHPGRVQANNESPTRGQEPDGAGVRSSWNQRKQLNREDRGIDRSYGSSRRITGIEYGNADGALQGEPSRPIEHRIAEQIVEIAYRDKIRDELVIPLERLQNSLSSLYESLERIEQQRIKNETLQAALVQKIAEQKATAKVEILGVALETWRSLNESQASEPYEGIQNLRAQTAIDIAMEQFTEARHIPKPKKVQKIEPFWVPEYKESDRPSYIEPHHWEEMQKSAIHPDLIRDNITSLGESTDARYWDETDDTISWKLLEHEFKKPRYGAGQEVTTPMIEKLNEYATLEKGGWWGTAGTDALSLLTETPRPSRSGVFKGDSPRVSIDPILKFKELDHNYLSIKDGLKAVSWDVAKRSPDDYLKYKDYQVLLNAEVMVGLLNIGINPNKFIKYEKKKYENPAGTARPVFLANVPHRLAQRIYKKHGIVPSKEDLKKGFWHIVRAYNLPISPIEGNKKAQSLLSQGIIAIGTPGVALYKAYDKNENGSKTKLANRVLIPELAVFATPGRVITFVNDQDIPTKRKTIWNVRRDTVRSAELFAAAECDVRIAKWDYVKGKGADDVIAKYGPKEILKAIALAEDWGKEAKIHYRAQYNYLNKTLGNELGLTKTDLDKAIYLEAIRRGDTKDGDRFLSQSDQARSQKDIPQSNPKYTNKHKDEYLRLTQQVESEMGTIPIERRDLEVYLRATKNKLKLINESPRVQELLAINPQLASNYVRGVEKMAGAYGRLKNQDDEEMLNKIIAQGVQGYMVGQLAQEIGIAKERRFSI